MACLQANAATAQKIGNSGNRFAIIPAVGADREDQVAEGHVFMGLFHGWKRGWRLKVKRPVPGRRGRWRSGEPCRSREDR
jgi:hypothetical protein